MKMTHQKKILIIKVFALIFLLLVAVFPLEDSPSVEAKSAVTVVAFDKKDDKIETFVQINVPQQQAQGSSKLLVVHAEGKDIGEAFEKLSTKMGLKIELAHCGIILVGEELAKQGFTDELDYILASGMISPQMILFVCEGKAEEFMQKLNEFSQTNGSGVFDVADFSENSINIRIVSVLKFLSENHTPSHASSLPIIGFEEDSGSGGGGGSGSGGSDSGGGSSSSGGSGGGSDSGGSGGSQGPSLKELTMSMLFKDGKAVGKMSPLGTKGLSMFDKKSNKGYFEADNVVIGDEVISYVPMQVRKKDGTIKAHFEDGKPIVTFNVNMELETETRFMISETGKFASKKKVKKRIAERAKEIVKEEIEEALDYAEKTGADILGLETQFYKQCNREYKIYGEQIDFVKNVQAEYKINVEVS